jgi:hypothetical protein
MDWSVKYELAIAIVGYVLFLGSFSDQEVQP